MLEWTLILAQLARGMGSSSHLNAVRDARNSKMCVTATRG